MIISIQQEKNYPVQVVTPVANVIHSSKICLKYGHSNTAFSCISPGIVSPQIMTTRYLNTNYIQFGTTFEGTTITNPVEYAPDRALGSHDQRSRSFFNGIRPRKYKEKQKIFDFKHFFQFLQSLLSSVCSC